MREIFCCGTGQRTPYCSMCGKRLQAYPLSDLLNHCREQMEKADDKFKKFCERFTPACVHADDTVGMELAGRLGIVVQRANSRALSNDQRKDYVKVRNEAAKWHSYVTALERIMKHAATLPPEAQDAPVGSNTTALQDGRNLEL